MLLPVFAKTSYRLLLFSSLAVVTISTSTALGRRFPDSVQIDEYARKTVGQLIDELVNVDSLAPGIDSAGVYEGFIAEETPAFDGGVLGVPPPEVPPAMRELARRGPLALAELVEHVDDNRPTRLQVGNLNTDAKHRQVGVNSFRFTYFSNEYDPRERSSADASRNKPRRLEKSFSGSDTVKVGDICFVLIGQIVNRRLLAVRYQATGGLVVNSPVEVSELAAEVRRDWKGADPETLRLSLLADIHGANRFPLATDSFNEKVNVFPALKRLRFYFPETYHKLSGGDLKKKTEFESQQS